MAGVTDGSDVGRWIPANLRNSISNLVRGRSALFLSELEGEIEVLDPASTVLVPDTSRTYNDALLYLESNRPPKCSERRMIHLGHRGAMNLVPYQLDPALQALRAATGSYSDRRRGWPG